MKNVFICRHVPLTVLVGIFFLSGCISDPNYDLDNLNNIDKNLKLFGEGVSLPLGRTEAITLKDALALAGSDLDSLIKKDAKGNYSLGNSGEYNLDEVIADMHLEKLNDINGAYFSKDVDYKIGDFDKSQFKISGKNYSYTSEEFKGFYLDDIPVPAITVPDQVIKAELYKYQPEDMDIGKKVGQIEDTEKLFDIGDVSSQIPGSFPGDDEVSIQPILVQLGKSELKISGQYNIDESISCGYKADKIADVKNFKIKNGGLMKVDLEVLNCPLTNGQMVPDLKLDMSSMFVLADAGIMDHKLDLSDMILKKDNSWKLSKSFTITSLASSFPKFNSGTLSLKGLMDLSGNIRIENAKSTPNTVKALSDKQMQLRAKISLDGVVLDEMDITLASGVKYSVPDLSMPLDFSYELPEGISSVNKIFFNQNNKININISATGLDNLKSGDGLSRISVIPDIELTFPTGLEVAEAVNGKVTIKGEDLYEGDIVKNYTLVSLVPTVSDHKLKYAGEVKAKVSASMTGTFDSKYLPKTEADDAVLTAKIGCQPVLKDYDIILDKAKITRSVSETEEFSFEIDGMADFGTFRIELKDNPKAVLEFNVPKTTEIDIVAENLVVTLPSMIIVDGSAISGFDSVKNTLTINGKLPAKIELPVKHLLVTPMTGEGGKTIVKGTFSVKGSLSVSDTRITRTTLDEINKKTISVSASIPSMEAKSIAMEGDFSKSLDYEAKDVVILDSEAMSSIPKEVKALSEINLQSVNAIIEIKVDGLPDLQGKFVLKDTRIQLPSFLCGENDGNMLILDDEIDITDGKAVVQTAQLTKLKNVQLSGVSEIKGDIKLFSTLYSHKPDVDISTLKSTIKATIKIGVGNGSQAEHPGKIAISKALVKVGYDMEQQQSISFGTIPAELQDEKLNFALNPEMHVELTTNFGAPVKGDFVLTPFIAGKALESVTIKGIELPCSDDWNKTGSNKYAIGANATASQDETLIATDLSPLLRRIPDSIQVVIKVGIDENSICTIYPSAKYNCNMNYKFMVPMSFGPDFNMNLKADVDVDEGTADYFRRAEKILLTGSYKTTLPIGAETVVTLLDSAMHVIELTEPAKLTLKKSDDGKRAMEDVFDLVLSPKDPANMNLSKIRFNFAIKASADVNLREDQYIQITKLSATLPNGINVTIPGE